MQIFNFKILFLVTGDWFYFTNAHYFASRDARRSRAGSVDACADLGGSLVMFDSESEATVVLQNTASHPSRIWTGLIQNVTKLTSCQSDPCNLICVQWSNPLVPFSMYDRIVRCLRHQPCLSFDGADGNWYGTNCEERLDFICEIYGALKFVQF